MKKRGFEMMWNVIIAMILAFMILLFLVLFFTRSSGSFLDNIKGYFSSSNVDSVVKSCNIQSTGGEYNFCCDKKDVKYLLNGSKMEGEFSCSELLNQSFIYGKINFINCEGIKC